MSTIKPNISAYSMAVTPESLAANRMSNFVMGKTLMGSPPSAAPRHASTVCGERVGTSGNGSFSQRYKTLATVLNVLWTLVPSAVTAPMMTTAIKAAMRPYSMAVTPAWSLMKRRRR
jgi:hypothetical protein